MTYRTFRIAALLARLRAFALLWLALSVGTPAFASQATLVTPGAPLPMTSLATFLNDALLSIGSCNSGNSAPANGTGGVAFPGECWINTTSNPWIFNFTPDGTHWVEFGSLNTSSFVWTPYTNGNPLALGTSVNNPGTGTIEMLLPIQTVTAASKTFGTSDFFQKTRRSNSGTAMADTFPASTATGLTNGTRIELTNVDASANDTVTAGGGTTIAGNSTFVVGPGRDVWFIYDAALTEWFLDANTGSALLAANNLSELANDNTAITTLFGGFTGTGNAVRATAPQISALGIGGAASSGGGVQVYNNLSANPTANGQAQLGGSTANGASLGGQGSTNDVVLYNKSGTSVCVIPTGTTSFNCPNIEATTALGVGGATPSGGGIQVYNNLSANPTANGQAQFGASTTNGAVLGGQGSTNDVMLYNKSGTGVCQIATGGTVFSCTSLGLTNPLTVANGGWGLGTLTSGAIYKGNGTSAPTASALSDNGTIVSSTEPVDIKSNSVVEEIANASATGTTLNGLAKLTGAPSTAVITSTSDTGGVAGVVTGGAGTTGNAQIAIKGQASCIFDGGTTAGDYVQISSTTGGDCHDAGSSYPTSHQVIGRVLSTNSGAGTYAIELFGPEIVASSGGSGGFSSVDVVAGTGLSESGTCNSTSSINCTINLSLSNVTLQSTVSNPIGTTSTAGAFMGLGSTCKFTPNYSGRVRISIEGRLQNNTSGGAAVALLYFGTGTAPSNGNTTLSSGSNVGPTGIANETGIANGSVPYHIEGILTGLTVGTAYWFDLVLSILGTGTASIAGSACNAMEF